MTKTYAPMTPEIRSPVLRYHGSKFRLAPWVISFFPDHATYVEPFAGGAAVLMQKPRSHSEIYNDIDRDIVTVFSVLRDPAATERLAEMIALTPYSRDEFNQSFSQAEDPVEHARRVIVRAYMGFGSAGATKATTGFRIDVGNHCGTAANKWVNLPEFITQFTERLQGVIIENRDALVIIRKFDLPDTLFFIDPPYMHSTRSVRGNGNYKHEMTDDHHSKLLALLNEVDGMVVLSGYDNELYRDALVGWDRYQANSRISAQRGTSVRVETLWLNPKCSTGHKQPEFEWD